MLDIQFIRSVNASVPRQDYSEEEQFIVVKVSVFTFSFYLCSLMHYLYYIFCHNILQIVPLKWLNKKQDHSVIEDLESSDDELFEIFRPTGSPSSNDY